MPTQFITWIYILVDPRTEQARYVGVSQNTKRRYREHLRAKGKTHRDRWIQHLRVRGMVPEMRVLERATEETWAARETWWITFYRASGAALLNVSAGGDGMHDPTPEFREGARARLLQRFVDDPSLRTLAAERIRNRWNDPGFRERNRVAVNVALGTPEMREVRRVAMKARWSDPAYREVQLAKRKARGESAEGKAQLAAAREKAFGPEGRAKLSTEVTRVWRERREAKRKTQGQLDFGI